MLSLVVPKQRQFAAKPAFDRRRLSDTFYRGGKPRAVSESPRGANSNSFLQTEFKRSLRCNMDLSSAVASYVPGSLDIADIPAVPVYNRATGRFRVFSSPTASKSMEVASNKSMKVASNKSIEVSSRPDSSSLPKKQEKSGQLYLQFAGESYNSSGALLAPPFRLAESEPRWNQRRTFSENIMALEPHFYNSPQSSLDSTRKAELPPLPRAAAGSVLTSSESDIFSSGSRSDTSSLELELTPRQRKSEILLDDLSFGFLGHVARRSVSTISTYKTVELGTFNDEDCVESILSDNYSIASEGSLWKLPDEGLLDRSRLPENSIVTPQQTNTNSSVETLDTPEVVAKSKQLASSRSNITDDVVPGPTSRSKKLPPVPSKNPGSKNPGSKKVAFCLDMGIDYNKSKFMIPQEYKIRPQKKNVKPRAVSQPNPILHSFSPFSKRSQPVAQKSAPLLPKPLKPVPLPPMLAKSHPVPFRTNVRIHGGL